MREGVLCGWFISEGIAIWKNQWRTRSERGLIFIGGGGEIGMQYRLEYDFSFYIYKKKSYYTLVYYYVAANKIWYW